MAYLIDSSCFIDWKNTYYAFDICPGFWEWLEQKNRENIVFSIEHCKNELTDGTDPLADWAKRIESTFFKPTDRDTIARLPDVVNWVEGQSRFDRHIKKTFMDKADPILIACALAHQHTIITHEAFDPNRLKIPTVCRALGVDCASIFELIRDSGAVFDLRP